MLFLAPIPLLLTWPTTHLALLLLTPYIPATRRLATLMRSLELQALTYIASLAALLVLLPSFALVVLDVVRFVGAVVRARMDAGFGEGEGDGSGEEKSGWARRWVQEVLWVVGELEAVGEVVRRAGVGMGMGVQQAQEMEVEYAEAEEYGVVDEPTQEDPPTEIVPAPVRAAPPATHLDVLQKRCGSVLMAVCHHSETLERLYSALQPPEVDDLIYCDCDEFEPRAEKMIALIGMLRECMERQTEVVKRVNDLYPMIPSQPPGSVDVQVECIDHDGGDSGFLED